MFRPIDLSSGNARSKAATVPPTITDRVPSIAPCCRRTLGVEHLDPFRAQYLAIRRVTDGEIVLLSTTTMPGRAPCTTRRDPAPPPRHRACPTHW